MNRLLILSMLLLATAGSPVYCEEVVRLEPAAMTRAGILVRPVLERAFGEEIRIFGEVVRSPGTTITVKTPVEGRILELLVNPGESVKAGEPLLWMHSHQVHAFQGEVLGMYEKMGLARSRAEAGDELYALQGISRIELEQRRQEAMAAELAYSQAFHELENLGFEEDDLAELLKNREPDGRMAIRALTAGVVLETAVHRHEWIQAFDPLLVVGDPDDVELQIKVQPSDASRVGYGDLIDFVPVGRPEAAGKARVLTPIPRVDPTTRTVIVRAKILENRARLFPGVFVEGVLIHGEASMSLSVPESAVIRIGGSDYVFVRLDDPNSFHARQVVLGRFNGSRYEITEGLAPGENVAVEGVFFLKSALLTVEGGE